MKTVRSALRQTGGFHFFVYGHTCKKQSGGFSRQQRVSLEQLKKGGPRRPKPHRCARRQPVGSVS